MRKEKEKSEVFQIADVEERELFSHLTSAVKMSHEKERAQAETVKYWSIIGSVLGALLGIIASGIGYRFRSTQIEEIKRQSMETLQEIQKLSETIMRLQIEIQELSKPPVRLDLEQISHPSESWGGYFMRKTVGVYRYFSRRIY